jgi:hypothetical protein
MNQPEEILVTPKEVVQSENFKDAEWVFQFDNEEPIVFAWSNDSGEAGEVNITLRANSNSSVLFSSASGDKIFRMYSRPITEETKKLRDSSGN